MFENRRILRKKIALDKKIEQDKMNSARALKVKEEAEHLQKYNKDFAYMLGRK